ncbi:MAG: hypothetical protein ACRCYO_17625, partial [Bacteroidia bacterium]
RQVFLLDGFGAVLTAFLVGFVLPLLDSFFKIPQFMCAVLSMIAIVLASYSFTCYFLVRKNWSVFLYVIAVANLLYCLLTLVIIFYNYEILSIYDLLYFGVEMLIVMVLAYFELRTAARC